MSIPLPSEQPCTIERLALLKARQHFLAIESGNPAWPTCAVCDQPPGTHRADCDVGLGLLTVDAALATLPQPRDPSLVW